MPVQADVNFVPQRPTSAAPAIPTARLQQLSWQPVDATRAQTTTLTQSATPLDVRGLTGAIAAYSLPANQGELTVTLSSEMVHNQRICAERADS